MLWQRIEHGLIELFAFPQCGFGFDAFGHIAHHPAHQHSLPSLVKEGVAACGNPACLSVWSDCAEFGLIIRGPFERTLDVFGDPGLIFWVHKVQKAFTGSFELAWL